MAEGQSANSPWAKEANVSLLRQLHADGLSMQAIADRIPGATKNGVVGRCHRMRLPPRQSPIRPANGLPYVRRAPAVTLPKLASVVIPRLEPQQSAAMGRRPPKPPAPTMDKEPERAPEPVVVPSPYKTCQWITSDRKPWLFCGDATDRAHGTYCTKHAKMSRGSTRFLTDHAA